MSFNGAAAKLKPMTAADCADRCVPRVLVVDDRARTRRALSAVLATRTGFNLVGEAADVEALAALEQLRPDIVIVDMRMPRLDGITMTLQIKTQSPWIRVVAHSLAEDLRADALAAGADAFVPKGAPGQELFDALEPVCCDRPQADASPPIARRLARVSARCA